MTAVQGTELEKQWFISKRWLYTAQPLSPPPVLLQSLCLAIFAFPAELSAADPAFRCLKWEKEGLIRLGSEEGPKR